MASLFKKAKGMPRALSEKPRPAPVPRGVRPALAESVLLSGAGPPRAGRKMRKTQMQ